MIELDPSSRPVRTREGYLQFEDVGVIGDGSTAAQRRDSRPGQGRALS
jgi:hypothetical protein